MIAATDTLAQAAAHLNGHDPVLAGVIARVGPCRLRPHAEYYRELVDSIISQQLSIKAAATIFGRFKALFGDTFPTPTQLLAKTPEELRAAGLSGAKAAYVHDLAQHIVSGTLNINALPDLENTEIIRELTAVKGIGEWTAHMFLIFSLGRLDVLPTGDLGIRSGIQKLYKLTALPDPTAIRTMAEQYNWHPYESVASWYIWQSLTLPVESLPKRP